MYFYRLSLIAAVIASTSAFCSTETSSSSSLYLHIHIPQETQARASHVLSHVVPEFKSYHPCIEIVYKVDADDEEEKVVDDHDAKYRVTFELSSSSSSDRAYLESYNVSRSPKKNMMTIHAGGVLGLGYAFHDLREFLVLGLSHSSSSSSSSLSLHERLSSFTSSDTPVYEIRTWSEEGQLLDIPDRSYYSDDGSSFNTSLLISEMQQLEYEIVPAMLRLRMNSITMLHSDLEDYITYDSFSKISPSKPAIYGPSDPHRNRQASLVAIMGPWVAHLTNDYGLTIYFQPYEFSSPWNMCGTSSFNCSLGSPDLAIILQARYTEFFAAVPAAAGIVATVTDSWSPRANYTFVTLWSSTSELAQVATLFYNVIVNITQKHLVFRLWTLGQAVDWATLRDGSPPGIEFSVKQSNGDFLLDYPINALLVTDPPAPTQRDFMVLVDAFRQYNGWTSSVCYMGSQWGPRLLIAAQNGVKDINSWGSWAPGCTWPDSGPTLVNNTAKGTYKSWRGYWNSYRMFNGTATNGGFSVGGQVNAYLLYRLSYNASADPTEIAMDFSTLYYGAENAVYVTNILEASIEAWYQTSVPLAIGDFTLFWTMMSHAQPSTWASLLSKNITADDCAASANVSYVFLDAMVSNLTLVDTSKIPASNPNGYVGLARAVYLAQGYLQAMFGWRETGLRNASLGSSPSPAACAVFGNVLASTAKAISAFGANYPLEDSNWAVSRLGEELYSAPPFLTGTEFRTMNGWIPAWQEVYNTKCA